MQQHSAPDASDYDEERLFLTETRSFVSDDQELFTFSQTKDTWIQFYTGIELCQEMDVHGEILDGVLYGETLGLSRDAAFQMAILGMMQAWSDWPEFQAEVARRRDLICRGRHFLPAEYLKKHPG